MEHLHKIADYFTGRLSPQEAKEVQLKIENDPEWAAEAAIQEELLFTAVEVKKLQLKAQFDAIEAKLQQQVTNSIASKITNFKSLVYQKVEYTLDQLTALFAPVPQYQPLLAMPMRGQDIEVLTPNAGVDCTEEGLAFKLSKGSEFELEVVVENNQCEEVYAQEVAPETADFTLSFSAKNYPPGRYYWKLMIEDEMVMSEFFVGKDALVA